MNAVDLFAGAGGMTTGATSAGLRVVAAVNHWPRAVETHAANHPATLDRVKAARSRWGDPCIVTYYGHAANGRPCQGRPLTRPLGTITTRPRFALVRGDRMRMLSVEELRRASGFPDGYRLVGTIAERVMQLGNAVPPPLAAAVIGRAVV